MRATATVAAATECRQARQPVKHRTESGVIFVMAPFVRCKAFGGTKPDP